MEQKQKQILGAGRAGVVAALALCIAMSIACSQSEANDSSAYRGPVAAVVLRDDLGREVKLPANVRRAVSLAPSVTELIFAAGGGDRLVGVTSYCDYPEAALSIGKVGDTQTPNIERIVALKPDVVFVSTASQLEAFTSTLAEQNIAVYVIDPKDIGEVTKKLRDLGEIFGTSQLADAAAAELERRAAVVAAKDGVRPRVFVQISREPLFAVGRTSFIAPLVERAGGELVTKDIASAFPKLSKETASAMAPDVIVLSDSEDNREPNDAFKNSPAVLNGRVYRIDADIISRPGPRLVDALEQISGFLRGR
ncbi:MAG: helical backbone metal receptor [Pyrinomonadaceae bacterium]